MKKIIKFSKSYREILNIKDNLIKENSTIIKKILSVNKKYSQQKKRKKCKNCNRTLEKFDFKTHLVKYHICKRCNHLNGAYEETDKFLTWLYNSSDKKKYGSSYLEKKNVSNKLKKIYEPKVNFLISSLKNKKFDVFEIGSGTGLFLKACENRKINGIGYETNKSFVSFADKLLTKNKVEHINIKNIEKIVLKNNRKVLVLISTLEHLKNPNKILRNFKKSKADYLYFNVPLFSLSSLIQISYQDVYPRNLSGAHTHLYTKESIDYFVKKFNFKIISEWWFGSDFADLYRSLLVSGKNKKTKGYIDKYFGNKIDLLQKILDRDKISSEVHMVLKK